MAKITEEQIFLENYDPSEYEPIAVTVDIVVFGVLKNATDNYRKLDKQSLNILLISRREHPFKAQYSLPGGFVGSQETIDETVNRVLKSKTGLDNIYCEQLYTFSEIDRDPRMRVISCAYIALVDATKVQLKDAEWMDIDRVTQLTLAFDHNHIIDESLKRLRGKINYTDIVFHVLPKQFTISELQEIYETILNKKLFAAAFRRTIMDKLVETGEYTQNAGHRPSMLFERKGER